MKIKSKLILIATVIMTVAGCASPLMVDSARQAIIAPANEQAQVVFIRSSRVGSLIQASLFDVSDNATRFIGILSSGRKLTHTVDPGKRVFMVVSEAADFIEATLDGGKSYYVMVTPRTGAFKARFSLHPVRNGRPGRFQYQSNEFQKWLKSTKLTENTSASHAWAEKNLPDVLSKQARYWTVWEKKSSSALTQRTLYPNDGIPIKTNHKD